MLVQHHLHRRQRHLPTGARTNPGEDLVSDVLRGSGVHSECAKQERAAGEHNDA